MVVPGDFYVRQMLSGIESLRSLASLACGGLRTTRRRVAPPRCTGFQSKDAAVACGCSYPGSALHKAGRDESRLIPA